MDTCNVLKAGLTHRISYETLLSRYRATAPPKITELYSRHNQQVFASAILWAFRVPIDEYSFGNTRVFFRPAAFQQIHEIMQAGCDETVAAKLRFYASWRASKTTKIKLKGAKTKLHAVVKLTKGASIKAAASAAPLPPAPAAAPKATEQELAKEKAKQAARRASLEAPVEAYVPVVPAVGLASKHFKKKQSRRSLPEQMQPGDQA